MIIHLRKEHEKLTHNGSPSTEASSAPAMPSSGPSDVVPSEPASGGGCGINENMPDISVLDIKKQTHFQHLLWEML